MPKSTASQHALRSTSTHIAEHVIGAALHKKFSEAPALIADRAEGCHCADVLVSLEFPKMSNIWARERNRIFTVAAANEAVAVLYLRKMMSDLPQASTTRCSSA